MSAALHSATGLDSEGVKALVEGEPAGSRCSPGPLAWMLQQVQAYERKCRAAGASQPESDQLVGLFPRSSIAYFIRAAPMQVWRLNHLASVSAFCRSAHGWSRLHAYRFEVLHPGFEAWWHPMPPEAFNDKGTSCRCTLLMPLRSRYCKAVQIQCIVTGVR